MKATSSNESDGQVSVVPVYIANSNIRSLSLFDISFALKKGLWLIAGMGLAFAIIAFFIFRTLPDVYTSEVTVAPSENASGSGLNSLTESLGGLASLTGLASGPATLQRDKVALEILQSRDFLSRVTGANDFAVELLAPKYWNFETQSLVIDKDVFDSDTQQWHEGMVLTDEGIPHPQIIHNAFLKILEVEELKPSGLFRISIEHESPKFASRVLGVLIKETNETMRQRDVENAEKTMAYLQEQLEITQVAEMRNVFFRLIEEQQKKMMLANVQKDYVLEVIDPAVVPYKKSGPRRGLGLIAITLAGLVLAMVISILLWGQSGRNEQAD